MHYALHARLFMVACLHIDLQRINIRHLESGGVCLLQDGRTGNQTTCALWVWRGWNGPCRKEVLAPKPLISRGRSGQVLEVRGLRHAVRLMSPAMGIAVVGPA
jgi:hypothetical protein